MEFLEEFSLLTATGSSISHPGSGEPQNEAVKVNSKVERKI